MSGSPNKLSNFWQELKRRRVIHVIIVYATAAFVIIELVGNVYESLQLPDWTPTLIILLIVIGFPFAIIFSWIYDLTLKGIKKTEPLNPTAKKKEDTPWPAKESWFENSIAVLPFEDMSPQKDQEYFCDGITEELINALTHVASLKVIARTSSFAFKGKQKDMREIGRKLDVETLLEGSIRKDGKLLRITAQLIKVADGSHLWSEKFDREIDDVFAIQDEISLAIVDHLKVKLLGKEKALMVKRPTEDPEVYNLYLKAMYHMSLATDEAVGKAIGYIGQALQKDPGFAAGYAHLGASNMLGSFFGNIPPNEGYPKAKEYAKRALEIDNTIAEAHMALGTINMFYDWNWKLAEKEFIQAIQLDPNNSWSRHNYALFLTFMDRNNEAIAEAEKAVALDPLNSFFNSELGVIYTYAHKFDRAREQLKWTITMYPDFFLGHFHLGIAYRGALRTEEAIEEFEMAVKLSGGIPIVVSFLALAYYEIGKIEEAEGLINSLEERSENEYAPAFCFSPYYLLTGDHDQAFRWLERAIDEHDGYLPLNVALPIKEYRIPNEPRYATLMGKVGLKKYYQNDW
jgi:adenylate cyclase